MPTLTLVPGSSGYDISNINFTNSFASFISVSQVQQASQDLTAVIDPTVLAQPYKFSLQNCTAQNNYLLSKDSLIEFGEINYQNF